MRVAYDFGKDHQRPESSVVLTPSSTPGMVNLMFEVSEPAAVFYATGLFVGGPWSRLEGVVWAAGESLCSREGPRATGGA